LESPPTLAFRELLKARVKGLKGEGWMAPLCQASPEVALKELYELKGTVIGIEGVIDTINDFKEPK